MKHIPIIKRWQEDSGNFFALVNQDDKTEAKTYDYYLSTLTRMVRNVYDGYLAGEFIDIMAGLINGQINQAYRQAWNDAGTGADGDPVPDYLTGAAEEMVLGQYDFVDGFFKDIITARLDETPVEPLLARCPLWANRWNEAYSNGVHLIQLELGGKEVWIEGDTLEKCPTCLALNGIVAFAHEWESAGFHPQGGPNPMLDCGGYNCQCRLEPTDRRRTPKALETLLNIATARGMKHLPGQHDQSTHGKGGKTDYSSVHGLEGKISGQSNESAGVFDKKGSLVFEQQGGHNVPFTREQVQKMDDAILTHNHPAAFPLEFSPDDIAMAVQANLREVRAVQGNKVCSFKRPPDGWGWERSSDVRNFFDRKQAEWKGDKRDYSGMLQFAWSSYAKSIGAVFDISDR